MTGKDVQVIEGKRRDGDPAVLVADSSQARAELDWAPQFDDLSSIVAHAWNWEQRVDGIQDENK